MVRKLGLMSSSAWLAVALATSAQAQTAAAPADAQVAQATGANTIQEVVVTAEKREESLQDVPTAITAFTSERRDLIGITTIQDMTNFTPGLQYSSQVDRTSLRGVGRLTNVRTAEGGVAIYSDGIYTTSTVEAGKSPLFVDRVEVLRGPQGTLYGRNSISGAINVISKRPTDEFYAEVRGQVGNYERTVYEGAISGPVTEGIQFRLAASREQQREGYFTNVVPGMPTEGNVIDQSIIEGQLQFQFTDRFDGWVKLSTINWNHGAGGPGARASWTPTPYETYEYANNALTLNPGYGCRPGTGVTNVVNASPLGCVNPALTDERKFASLVAYDVDLNSTAILASEFTYAFDNIDLRYIGGGTRYHYELETPLFYPATSAPITQYTLPRVAGGAGLTVFPRYGSKYEEEISWQSHEINLASTSDSPFQWLAGLYYFKENDKQPVSTTLFDQPQAGGPYNPLLGGTYCAQTGNICAPQQGRTIYDNRPTSYIESKAVYGQIDYEFVPNFTLTAGLRYTDDVKGGVEEVRVNCFAVASCLTPPEFLGLPATAFLGGVFPLVDVTQIPTVTSQPGANALPPGVVSRTTFDPATGFARREFEAEWSATTGTLGIQWEPDADTNVYARYSRGFKAGGFRVGIDTTLGASPLTDAESADNYELGFKRNFFNDTFQANVSVFRLNYDNAQVPLSVISTSGGLATSQAIFYNVPEAVSQGVELELNWLPIENLQLLVNYSYLDTEVTNATGVIDPADPAALAPNARPTLTAAQCAVLVNGATTCTTDVFTAGQPNGGFQRGQDLSGNHLPNAPEHKVALNANYTVETSAGDIVLSGTYVWRDEQYGSIFDRDYYKSPAYDQIDARVTFRSADDRYSVILYGRNLTDEIGYEGGAAAARKAGFTFNGVPPTFVGAETQGVASTYPLTPPRTFGVELQYRFF